MSPGRVTSGRGASTPDSAPPRGRRSDEVPALQRHSTGGYRQASMVVAASVTLFLTLVLGLALTGCGPDDEVKDGGPATSASTTNTTAPAATTTSVPDQATTTVPGEDTVELRVYFALDEKMQPVGRQVPKTEAVAAAAVEELLEGPTPSEAEVGLTTSIPGDSRFLGVSIADKVATVDLSKEFESGGGTLSMAMRLAQVVFTLTQFPTVEAVQFKLDGAPVEVFSNEGIILDAPVSRDDYEELTPAVLVESPTIGDTVSSPVRIWGTANTFEATFMINIVDWDGKIVAEQHATATSGTGTRGTFDVTVPFEWELYPRGALIVFEQSAEDGRPINIVEVPLDFEE
jgi:germination protein M